MLHTTGSSACRETEQERLKVVGRGLAAVYWPGQPKVLGSIPSTTRKKKKKTADTSSR